MPKFISHSLGGGGESDRKNFGLLTPAERIERRKRKHDEHIRAMGFEGVNEEDEDDWET